MSPRSYALAAFAIAVSFPPSAFAGQPPGTAAAPDIAIGHRDRFYTSDQFSNTVSVIDPADNKLLGVIRLGDPTPGNLSPLYRGQLLVHGMGFSPDHHTLLVVSIGSNSVSFIDTETNQVKHTTYVGRSPHEAFFTPNGAEVWVTVRGENYVSVLDPRTYLEKTRIVVPNGPGMTIFSPDGRYGYVCSSFSPETVVIATASHRIVGRVQQESPFCPDLAATPDGSQVWMTLKDVGRVMVFDAKPPFAVIKVFETGPLTNHVNFVRTARGQFAYVTIGGLDSVKVFRTDTFEQVGSVKVGAVPHGLWPSGDGTRVYVGLENADAVAVLDTASNTLVTEIGIGQGAQGVAYVPNAVSDGTKAPNLAPLGLAGEKVTLSLLATDGHRASEVTLFNQGLVQVLQAVVTGLTPGHPYVLALAGDQKGAGTLEPLANFKANPAGAAVVNAVGPLRQIIQDPSKSARRFLVVADGSSNAPGARVQVQAPGP